MMNSAIVSNINGGVSNQQVANGSRSSLLLSSIEFAVTEVKTNFPTTSYQGKVLTKLNAKEDIFNGQNKAKNCNQNENSFLDNSYLSINGNSEKSVNGNRDLSPEDSVPVPKVQLYTGKIHVEWDQVYKIGAGLHNLGNTCFMNTVIQCLTYCPPLANYLLHDDDHSSKCAMKGFCMMCILQKHMKRTIGKTGEVIKPLDVYQRLRIIAKHFQFGRQEDAHEFLRYVIENLWKSCLPQTNGVSKLDPASKQTTVINKIFGGYHRSQVICLRCKKESNTFDHFMDFILDIKQNVTSLEKALEKFTQPELLQHDNCYKCPKCKMKVEAQKRFSVYTAPTVATFQLKRFDYNRAFGGKITKQITYPERLNLRPYMSETQGEPVWYRLNAVLVHSGHTCTSGHYYCYVKNSNGFWYIMDDSRVSQVGLNQVLNQSAYVLFYIKMENSERAALKKCLDNKSTIMKGTIPNSHFSKLTEMNNLKSSPLNEKISSPFSSSKVYGSPNSIKKFNGVVSSQNRDVSNSGKVPLACVQANNNSALPLSSPKSRTASLSEPLSTLQGGLVPYIEDSSESSDAGEINLSQNDSINSIKNHVTKNGSIDSHRSSPQLEIRTKLSKSLFSPALSSRCYPVPKVSATGSWIVTEVTPDTPVSSSPSTTGVTSTTDWQVIEATDLQLDSSCKMNDSMGELVKSPRASATETQSSKYANSIDPMDPSESSPSTQKCNFRKQQIYSKSKFPEDGETTAPGFKRKLGDSYSKVSKDSSHPQHSEGGYSPVPKKAKYAESASSSLMRHQQENGTRNSFHVDNSNCEKSSVHRQYLNCDNSNSNRTTCLVNGASSISSDIGPRDNLGKSPVVSNGLFDKDKKISVFSKVSFSESKPSQYDKEKLPTSNSGENSSLYGTEIPTWRAENHYRPSLNSAHENRRKFDDYDNEFDRGKVRKSKTKNQYQHFPRKNPFQKHSDKYSNAPYYPRKFYNGPQHHRKWSDSRHHWKPNHSSNYHPRYQNNHQNNRHRHY